jgi:ubiquinol-cytochrome c reductase iron-sulfur subunit
MADSVAQAAPASGETRRDFLSLVTASFAAVGVGALAWPFISAVMARLRGRGA